MNKERRLEEYTLKTEIRFARFFFIKEYPTSTEIAFSPATEMFVAGMDARLHIVGATLKGASILLLPSTPLGQK
jgi:hypothetical protein